MSADKKGKAAAGLKGGEKTWSKALMGAGWLAIPSVLLERQRELDLDAVDVNILLHLTARGKASPSKGAVAQAMNLDPRTIQRRIAKLEADGYLKREERRDTPTGSQPNLYHLDGLIAATRPFTEEKAAAKAAKKAGKAERKAAKGEA